MNPMEFIDQSVIPVAQNLIAMVIGVAIGKFITLNSARIDSLKTVATKTTATVWSRYWRTLAQLIGLVFIVTELRNVVQSTEPLTRLDVLLIALWTSLACLLYAAILFLPIRKD